MNLLQFFRRPRVRSAQQAKERLQVLLTHERGSRGLPDFLPRLQQDLLRVLARYVRIDRESVQMQVEDDGGVFTLEINVELPGGGAPAIHR
ncbi:MAG: cell division topological specificity factor MinE [Alphaproteobacteria bacterium]|nr:cell division topological specificity factor MinE [Alphaproteobacteria bacterium]